MRTIKCGIIAAGCIGLIIFGIFILDWLILIFILPLLVFLFAGVLTLYNDEIKIEVSRNISNNKIFEYDNVEVNLKIKNLGDKIRFLEVFDALPDKVKIVKGSNYSVIDIDQNEEIQIKYEISCPIRGRYEFGSLLFRVRGFFGMFYKEAIVESSTYITVIPRVEEIRDVSIKAKPNIYPGIMQVKHAGIGTEFFGIRDYTTGDTYKRINWKTFARFNNLMVNEFELESTTDVILIIDTRENQGYGTIKHNALEFGIKAAVTLASHFLKRRDRIGVITYGPSNGELNWIYPESGKKQLYKIIEEIVNLQATGDFPFNGVVYRAATHLLPKKSLIIFISSLENDWSIPKGLEQLIAYDFNVIILSPSPVDIEFSLQKVDIENELAHRILTFERKNFLAQLRGIGVRVVDWNPTLPLTVALEEVGKYQTRR